MRRELQRTQARPTSRGRGPDKLGGRRSRRSWRADYAAGRGKHWSKRLRPNLFILVHVSKPCQSAGLSSATFTAPSRVSSPPDAAAISGPSCACSAKAPGQRTSSASEAARPAGPAAPAAVGATPPPRQQRSRRPQSTGTCERHTGPCLSGFRSRRWRGTGRTGGASGAPECARQCPGASGETRRRLEAPGSHSAAVGALCRLPPGPRCAAGPYFLTDPK